MHLTTIADSVTGALPCCDDPPLALALLHALAGGEPVPHRELVAATGREQANRVLREPSRAWVTVEAPPLMVE